MASANENYPYVPGNRQKSGRVVPLCPWDIVPGLLHIQKSADAQVP
jgi:hypothetical protein